MEPSDPPCDPSEDIESWVIYTRLDQGLPARVEDPVVLGRIADLIRTPEMESSPGANKSTEATKSGESNF